MTTIGISLVKDEADIIAATVTHMASQVDSIIIADNLSSDGTRDILETLAFSYPIEILTDDDPAYYQSVKMTRLAGMACERGADWVVPFDADEIWLDPFFREPLGIKRFLEQQPDDISIVEAQLVDHVATGADPEDSNPITRIGWHRRTPLPLPKVAVRTSVPVVIDQGNHGAWYSQKHSNGLHVRHFPYRSATQFESKVRSGAAAYAATDLPESIGAHWRQYGRILDTFGPEGVHEIFRKWFWVEDPNNDPTLILDPAPTIG